MYSYCISNWYIVTSENLLIHSSSDAVAVTISSLDSNFYMVFSLGRKMQGLKLTGSTGSDRWIRDKSGIVAGGREWMGSCVCGFWEPSLILLLPGREVTCGICNLLRTLWRVSRGSLNVVGTDDAAPSAVWGWTTAGTFDSVVPYFLSLSRN